jgi:thiol-disulfide isomerase/thioredoxin
MLSTSISLALGIWRAVLLTPGGELPFNFEVSQRADAYTITIINGEERLQLDDILIKGDSVIAQFPVYESELRLKIKGDSLTGVFTNLTRQTNASIPLLAKAGDKRRFAESKKATSDPTGKWSIEFSPMQKTKTNAVGVFEKESKSNRLTGTFLTPSGDYSYLEGTVSGDSLYLSTFNGVFVYLFKAKISDNTMRGMHWSGTHHSEPWSAVRNANAKLPDPNALTTMNGPFGFSFPDLDSMMVSLDDERFKNKVVVVQFLGSWCPNCLDETAYLTKYYDKNASKGMEIVGLSFEKTDSFQHAVRNVTRFKNRFDVKYPLLIVGNRSKRQDIYPGLQNFQGYPTTIFLDKQHRVRKIHAGFNGPATGAEYEKFKDEFENFIKMLLNE